MGEWRFGGSGGRGSKLICMDAELKVSLQAIREQLEELKEQQAEVQREFRAWAKTAEARYRQSQAVMKVLDERVMFLEERVQEIVLPRRAS